VVWGTDDAIWITGIAWASKTPGKDDAEVMVTVPSSG